MALVVAMGFGCDDGSGDPDAGAADDGGGGRDGGRRDTGIPGEDGGGDDPDGGGADDGGAADDATVGDAGGAPQIELNEDDHVFSSIPVGVSAGTFSFIATNVGTAASGTLTASILGGSGSFLLMTDTCSTTSLAPDGGCTLIVEFQPLRAGTLSATLVLEGPGGSLAAVASLEGYGQGPARFEIEPASFDFGDFGRGGVQPTQVFTVTNVGDFASGLPTGTLVGPGAAQFLISNFTCNSAIAAGDDCTYTVTFLGTATGSAAASLDVSATPGGSEQASIVGNALAPANPSLLPTTRTFATTEVGAVSAPLVFTYFNFGATPTEDVMTTLSGGFPDDFNIVSDDCAGAPVGGGSSCDITLEFEPSGLGLRSANMVVESPGFLSATLLGTGIARRALVASPFGHGFGSVPQGGSDPSQRFFIRNPSALPTGAISWAITGGGGSFTISGETCSAGLAPDATCSIDVVFEATGALGNVPIATLTLTPASGPVVSFTMAATRVAPADLVWSINAFNFGSVAVNTTSSTTFTLRNAGAVNTTAIALGLASSVYAIGTEDCDGAVLAPSETCDVEVEFTPDTGGDVFASLTATATTGGAPSVSLQGVGSAGLPLTFTVVGDGFGQVEVGSSVCPADCDFVFATGSVASFEIVPEAGSEVINVTGGATCVGNSCTVPMDQARTILVDISRIRYDLEVTPAGEGTGVVTSGPLGIDCGVTCTAGFLGGELVTLTAVPNSPMDAFVSWSGACDGILPTCQVTMDQARSVTARFEPYNVAFVTSERFVPGALGSVANADAHCARLATGAGFRGEYRAWLASSTEGARDHVYQGFGAPRGFVRPDGRPFVEGLADLAAGRTQYPPMVDEQGVLHGTEAESVGYTPYVTGTDGTGGISVATCGNWTSTTGDTIAGAWGGWGSLTSHPCNRPARLLCMGTDGYALLRYTPAEGRTVFSMYPIDPSTGITAIDGRCQAEATSAGLSGTYRAFLSTLSATASSRFTTTGATWVRPDGVRWFEEATELDDTHGVPVAPAIYRANGSVQPLGLEVWTGGDPDVDGATCEDWTSASSSAFGAGGFANSFGAWFRTLRAPCDRTLVGVYCLEE